MGANPEEMLVQRITEIYEAVSKLPNLSPSDDVDKLFTDLVLTCIPPIAIDVPKLSKEVQDMRANLIALCGHAEGLMESHYSDLLASYENPLDHLDLFPYYYNYVKLSQLEFDLLSRFVPEQQPTRVAFIGSGSLPLTSIVLACRHMQAALFDNYDLDSAANARARRLVRAEPGMSDRVVFHTADVLEVGDELAGYDVVFLAALVGVGRREKAAVIEHLERHMAAGALLVVRSAHGARAFLYPVVEPEDLERFQVLDVYHPVDEVINSVIVARKPGLPPLPLRRRELGGCDQALQGIGAHFGNGSTIEEVAVEELQI